MTSIFQMGSKHQLVFVFGGDSKMGGIKIWHLFFFEVGGDVDDFFFFPGGDVDDIFFVGEKWWLEDVFPFEVVSFLGTC